MAWYTLYETATGKCRAHTSVLPSPVPPEFTVIDHGSIRQDQENTWNQATRTWVARVPDPVVDRLQDLANHPYAAEMWSRLTPAQRVKMRKLFVWLLGTRRYRQPLEDVSLDVEQGWPTDPSAVNE